MKEKSYLVTLRGTTEMFHHSDSVDWADELMKARLRAKKDKTGVPGDDRSPAWTWVGYTYFDGEDIAIPFMNLSASLMRAGAQIGTGKKQQTFKSATQSGIRFAEPYWKLLVKGKPIAFAAERERLMKVSDFGEHKAAARAMGFTLDARRVTVGTSKHIRVRPLFAPGWTAVGEVQVIDERITEEVLRDLFTYAGRYVGIGDWRPGAPKKPGPFGTFAVDKIEAA
jgi:hypothetical protein